MRQEEIQFKMKIPDNIDDLIIIFNYTILLLCGITLILRLYFDNLIEQAYIIAFFFFFSITYNTAKLVSRGKFK